MNLCNINDIRNILSRHGFRFSKGLGQNFLCAADVPPDIASSADIDESTCVLEVGPGIGTLTAELCPIAKKVVSIELDTRLLPVLGETMAEFNNFKVVQGDILKTNIGELCREEFGDNRVVACANLPYYITTPAISALMESRCFDTITVMVQKEVAQRICAREGTSEYGAFTVYVRYFASASIVLDVARDCFIPAPNVDSAVVRLDMHEKPSFITNEKMFFRVMRAAFAQRRKTLLNCLRHSFTEISREDAVVCITSSGLEENIRGEQLSIEQFAVLAQNVEAKIDENNAKN